MYVQISDAIEGDLNTSQEGRHGDNIRKNLSVNTNIIMHPSQYCSYTLSSPPSSPPSYSTHRTHPPSHLPYSLHPLTLPSTTSPCSLATSSQNLAITTSFPLNPTGLCVVQVTVVLLYTFVHSGWWRCLPHSVAIAVMKFCVGCQVIELGEWDMGRKKRVEPQRW